MHISLTRRSRALALGVATLTGALVFSGLATGTAAAEQAPLRAEHLSKAEVTGNMAYARELSAKRAALRAGTRTAAAAAAPCWTRFEGAGVTMTRVSGANRYGTAICSSQYAWWDHNDPDPEAPKANAVVLARGDAFPDALAGGPLAGYVNGPLLLNNPFTLLPEVRAEIQRVLAPGGTVYLLGGTGSLSNGVQSAITSLGYKTVRLGGANRFETAIRIAREIRSTNLFFVTTGMNFPDALAAGGFAANYTQSVTHGPNPSKPIVLLFTNDTRMPTSTRDFIVERANQFPDGSGTPTVGLLTAGGAANTATRAVFGDIVDPYVGSNRFETAALIAEAWYTDNEGKLIGAGVGLANGMNFPDALAGTSMLMNYAQPLLLARTTVLDAPTKSFLTAHAGDVTPTAYLDVLGGTGVVSNSVANAAMLAFS
ncbi:cell wall-binding repeat-containing protein [Actinokineospora sp. NPDC004072]